MYPLHYYLLPKIRGRKGFDRDFEPMEASRGAEPLKIRKLKLTDKNTVAFAA